MHAPVETPLNLASVRTATCFPNGRYRSAPVNWNVSSIPAPIGPRQMSTRTSPSAMRRSLIALIAAGSLVKMRAGPVNRYTPSVSDDRRIDRGALDDRTFGRKVADREAHGRRQAPRRRIRRRHDHVVRIHALL